MTQLQLQDFAARIRAAQLHRAQRLDMIRRAVILSRLRKAVRPCC